jgi:hypothetical protein
MVVLGMLLEIASWFCESKVGRGSFVFLLVGVSWSCLRPMLAF